MISETKLDERFPKLDERFGHLFSEKAFHQESITLNNNNKAIINDEELAEKLANLNLLKNSKL